MFYVGQKVVCINDCNGNDSLAEDPIFGRGYAMGLRKGEIYTIISTYRHFVEVDRVKGGCGWDIVRFRPLVENKRATDISIFQRILARTKVPERV
jgi:hypothetical protein